MCLRHVHLCACICILLRLPVYTGVCCVCPHVLSILEQIQGGLWCVCLCQCVVLFLCLCVALLLSLSWLPSRLPNPRRRCASLSDHLARTTHCQEHFCPSGLHQAGLSKLCLCGNIALGHPPPPLMFPLHGAHVSACPPLPVILASRRLQGQGNPTQPHHPTPAPWIYRTSPQAST